MMMLKFKALGDQGVQILFGDQICEKTCLDIQAFSTLLTEQKTLPIYECVPAYTTLNVYYNPLKISYGEIVSELTQLASQANQVERIQPYIFEIPTVYGGGFGPDLEDVAAYHQLTTEEIIRLHTQEPYLIYMLGFTPGFPYLGGMPEQIATPRLANPRANVPAGSVGIAGGQTGIYPVDSPGGWRIIGRTPVKLYRPELKQPFLFEAGNYLKFIPVNADTYEELAEEWEKKQLTSLVSYPLVRNLSNRDKKGAIDS